MSKAWRLLISILYVLTIVNCQLEPNITVETEEKIMSNDFTVKPFKEFPAYYVQGNRVSGISTDNKSPEDLTLIIPEIEIDSNDISYQFDEFFVKDGKPCFSMTHTFIEPDSDPVVITKYCTQTDGKITYLTKTKFPKMPDSIRIEGQFTNFDVITEAYQDNPISVISRNYSEPMGFIDGAIQLNDGILIHAPIGREPSRPSGLLFWPDNARNMNSWKEVGRFWK